MATRCALIFVYLYNKIVSVEGAGFPQCGTNVIAISFPESSGTATLTLYLFRVLCSRHSIMRPPRSNASSLFGRGQEWAGRAAARD